ncbi:hypothetical protein WJX84_006526 [Apatococcus fuscideae]|uniref:LisH domain-containing protein n=1 Tax=Apatococcus fuscideae TaxID=2026836 RepID=A0AAW1SST3_9CHLO
MAAATIHALSGVPPAQSNQVIQYLLANNYLLTALELLLEAQEAGREGDVDSLQEYFADRDRFPPEDVVKLGPADAMDLQQLAKQREERLALLEYELRVAQEDRAEMQKRLDRVTEVGLAVPEPGEGFTETSSAATYSRASSIVEDALPESCSPTHKTHLATRERKELNSAIRGYLLGQGCKLTAITFLEEAGAAFSRNNVEDTATALATIFHGHKERNAALASAEEARQRHEAAESQVEQMQQQAAGYQDALDSFTKENVRLRADIEFLQRQLDFFTQAQAAAEAKKPANQSNQASPIPAPQAKLPEANGKTSRSSISGKAGKDALAGAAMGFEAALNVVAEAVPRIQPHVLINKREELLPVLVVMIQELRDAHARDRLTHCLFNLVKKPTAEQRALIMDGCVELASRIGPARTAEELLPQCWEQVNNKYPERRMLVAEACGRLAGSVAAEMRPSLVLSILQQLATDASPAVRRTVVLSLASLLPSLPDTSKYSMVEALLLQLVQDSVPEVVEAVFQPLLPTLLKWMGGTDLLHSSLLTSILTVAKTTIQKCPIEAGMDEFVMARGDAEMRSVGDQPQRQVQVLLRLYTNLLPALRAHALATQPSWVSRSPTGGEEVASSSNADLDQRKAEVLSAAEATDLPAHVDNASPAASDLHQEDLSAAQAGAMPSAASHGSLHSQEPSAAVPPDRAASLPDGSAVSIASEQTQADDLVDIPLQDERKHSSHVPSEGSPTSRSTVMDHPLSLQPAASHPLDAAASDASAVLAAEAVREGSSAASSPTKASEVSTRFQAASYNLTRPPDDIAAVAFGQWCTSQRHAEWACLEWLITTGLPLLIKTIRMVSVHSETEALRSVT